MSVTFDFADITIEVVKKDIKHLRLSVHPPEGRVSIAAPHRMKTETIRLFAISKLPWIRQQQQGFLEQERETPREHLTRESHYVWGKRYLLRVVERAADPTIVLTPQELWMYVRPQASPEEREQQLAAWYRERLRLEAQPILEKWQERLAVKVKTLHIRQMKTKWGSCNPNERRITLNTELAKKPRSCLEYVALHECIHFLEPTHNDRFVALMNQHAPDWQKQRELLNSLPLRHEDWPSLGEQM